MAVSLVRAAAVGAAVSGGMMLAGGAAAAALLAVGVRRWRESAYDLDGRNVLVTGGSRGLGFAIAREFLRRGSRVALCARNPAELERAAAKLAAYGEVFTHACDLTRPEAAAAAVEAVRQRWGRLDVLVHDAGIMQVGPWETMEEADFRAAMDLHFWAALRLAQAALPEMIARRSGRIVNISSIGGVVAVPHMLPYTASKFALAGLSQGLASEVRRHGVRVTCVCPFLTRTGSQDKVEVRGRHRDEFAWFATSGSLPVLTQSAGAAARAVVRACRRGQALAVLALPGKLAALAHGVAPSLTTAAMGVANRFLPAPLPPGAESAAQSGGDSYNDFTARVVQPLVRRAGEEVNQS